MSALDECQRPGIDGECAVNRDVVAWSADVVEEINRRVGVCKGPENDEGLH